jgi:hypothetical protein
MTKHILLTGASGYLAGNLLARLSSASLPPCGRLLHWNDRTNKQKLLEIEAQSRWSSTPKMRQQFERPCSTMRSQLCTTTSTCSIPLTQLSSSNLSDMLRLLTRIYACYVCHRKYFRKSPTQLVKARNVIKISKRRTQASKRTRTLYETAYPIHSFSPSRTSSRHHA